MEPRKESSRCQRCRRRPETSGQVKEGVRSGTCGQGSGSFFPLWRGLSCWKRAASKGPVVISFRVEEVSRSVREITSSQEGSWALPLGKANLPNSEFSSPFLGMVPVPRNRSQVQAPWSYSSRWFCQAGGRGRQGSGAAPAILLPRDAAAEPNGESRVLVPLPELWTRLFLKPGWLLDFAWWQALGESSLSQQIFFLHLSQFLSLVAAQGFNNG